MSAFVSLGVSRRSRCDFFSIFPDAGSCCRRRPRGPVAVSRSLESYREGSRRAFDRDGRTRNDRRPYPPRDRGPRPTDAGTDKAPKTRTTLLKAMCKANVASSETCSLLIRNGKVDLNGNISKDKDRMVNTKTDVLHVNGREMDIRFFEKDDDDDEDDDANGNGPEEQDQVEDEGSLTRVQRDFRTGKYGQKSRQPREKKYSRHVDGGFLSSRTGMSRK